jgi:hypothetical protein
MTNASEAHTIAECLIEPCLKDVVQCMRGENAAKILIWCICPIICCLGGLRRISIDVESTIVQTVRNSTYCALQVGETTDISNLFALIVSACHVNEDKERYLQSD